MGKTKKVKAEVVPKQKDEPFFKALQYDIKNNKWLLMLCLPAILFFIVFSYIPMCGIIIAFQKFNISKGIFGSKFIGFDNFKFFVGSDDFFRVTFNTLFLNILFICCTMIFAITIAIVLSEIKNKWFKKISQSIVILPHFISWTVVALLLEAFISSDAGYINRVIESMGGTPIQFYNTAAVWPVLLTILRIWHGAGFDSIVYLAAITGIDQEVYEAARVDGASRFQCIRYITLPLLKSTAVLLLIMAVGKIFNGDFGMIYALVGSNTILYSTTDVIDTYVYRQLMELGDLGMSAAVSLLQSVIGFTLVYLTNLVTRKLSPDSAIF
ncbi:MAG: ABC transporter permease [Lachnospiraceae bacterium]